MDIRVCGIAKESIVDGPGLRYVIFAQGCPHRCEGCHNPQSHSFDGGTLMSVKSLFNEIKKNPLLSGVTFSGGEPFCQAEAFCELADMVKSIGKTVMTYTGYTIEELLYRKSHLNLLEKTDILVDGKYIKELRDYQLKFKGSSNQRTIKKPLLFLYDSIELAEKNLWRNSCEISKLPG